MNNKEYLNEEQYQKNKKKINDVGTILLIIGIIMLFVGFIMAFGFGKLRFFIFAVIGLPLAAFGGQAKLLGHGREISAYMAQQQMPITQENIEKMAPSVGKAAGTVSKEIVKGIKEEMDDKE